MNQRILVGTSSWADPGFVEKWYPHGMTARERLPWYSAQFEAVEVNSTFYAIPAADTVRRWAEVTPEGFTFDVKLHRLLSRHAATLDSLPKDLREHTMTNQRGRVVLEPDLERAVVERTLTELEPLVEAGKLGAFLLQLTPAFAPGESRLDQLDDLVEALKPHRVAVELRHRGWVREKRLEETLAWFSDHDVAYVGVDAPPGDHIPIMPALDAVTADGLAYLRMHGRNTEGYLNGKSVAERFGWIYSDAELEEIAGRARGLAEEAGEVHVMFNNNRDDDAPTAATRLRALLGQEPPGPPEGEQMRLGEEA